MMGKTTLHGSLSHTPVYTGIAWYLPSPRPVYEGSSCWARTSLDAPEARVRRRCSAHRQIAVASLVGVRLANQIDAGIIVAGEPTTLRTDRKDSSAGKFDNLPPASTFWAASCPT